MEGRFSKIANMKPFGFSSLLIIGGLACSQGRIVKSTDIGPEVPYHQLEDFSGQWKLIGLDFSEGHKDQIISLSPSSKNYLKGLAKKIRSNNELLFEGLKGTEILIINHKKPFHFSVPNGKIFISVSLLRKYIKYEGLLASILTLEMIRSHKKIFMKNIMVPTGAVSFENLRPLLKIRLDLRNEINKWAIYTLKRSEFEPLSLLRLLQVKNKNFLDFFDTPNEVKDISLEEVQLKSFLVRFNIFSNLNKVLKNSSKEFYHFINEVNQS